MTAVRRALPALAALLTLSSCGIPATGVVEAGGPATGIASVTTVYFLRDGALTALMRPAEFPGDAGSALQLLLEGPPSGQRLDTEVRPPGSSLAPDTALGDSAPTPSAAVVTEDRGTLVVRLPSGMAELSDLGIGQVVCTVAAARRVSAPELPVVTVDVLLGGRPLTSRTDARCPQL
ncbi:MAG TPA: hypothetical protein VIU15_07930 [Streptomyces sp.]